MNMYIYPDTYTHTDRHTYILRCMYSFFLSLVCVLRMTVVLDFDSVFSLEYGFHFSKNLF